MDAASPPRPQAEAATPPPRPPWRTVGAATTISALALLSLAVIGQASGQVLLIPPMAASMALVAGAPTLPLAQPRSVILGQLVSAVIGVLAGSLGHNAWMAALAGGLSLGAMMAIRAPHSPAAATAVLGVYLPPTSAIAFVACVGAAALVLVLFGWLRSALGGPVYPTYWV